MWGGTCAGSPQPESLTGMNKSSPAQRASPALTEPLSSVTTRLSVRVVTRQGPEGTTASSSQLLYLESHSGTQTLGLAPKVAGSLYCGVA